MVRDGESGTWQTTNPSDLGCGGGTVFWISNIQNHINNNAAVGGHICYWLIPHESANHNYAHMNTNPQLAPWMNNKGSSCDKGLFVGR